MVREFAAEPASRGYAVGCAVFPCEEEAFVEAVPDEVGSEQVLCKTYQRNRARASIVTG